MHTRSQRITPFLWFDHQAEEAARFYTAIFPDSKIHRTTRYTKEGAAGAGRTEGEVMTVEFELDGQELTAINGGPIFHFTEALSLVVNCASQEEVDYYWERLGAGGDPNARQCGWLKDRYGLSWQIVPTAMFELLADPDRARAGRAMQAMLGMKKLDLAELRRAAASGGPA